MSSSGSRKRSAGPDAAGRAVRPVLALLALAAVLGAAPPPQARPARPRDLPPAYREWLEQEVVYIITEKERDVFLQLASDRERDMFIRAFWRQRDPTPGTPANEFREEHARRIAYADEFFSRDTTRPGRMTDRGRVHIVLGPPLDISRIEGESFCYPAQIWSYAGEADKGLPSHFEIVFFKRRGTGEYVLYSPSEDGPTSLLVNYRGDPTDASAAYAQLRKFDARLADASLSLIPGEIPSLGQSALASDLLLARVLAAPSKSVDARYAEALLKYKDLIEVDYSANYIGSDSLAAVIRDPSGLFFVHYAIRPETLSVTAGNGRYALSFEINGMLKDRQGRVVFQYDKAFPLEFGAAQIEEVRRTGVLIEDAVPLAPGEYDFSLLLKNTGSREFASFEKRLVVPADFPAGCAVSPLLLGYRAKGLPAAPRQVKPFRAGDTQLFCRPGWTFGAGETLAVFFQVYALSADLRRAGRLEYVFERQGQEVRRTEVPLAELPPVDVVREFPLAGLAPAAYRLRVTVRDAQGGAVVSTAADLEVSPVAAIPEPVVAAKVMPPADHPMYAYLVGSQLMKAGDPRAAGGLLASAYRADPRMLDYAQAYAEWLAQEQDHVGALEVLGPFAEAAADRPEVLADLGKWSQALKRYRQAVGFYQAFLDRAGQRPDVLNAAAECHLALGDPAAARAAWERSLAIDPRQESVRTSLERLKR